MTISTSSFRAKAVTNASIFGEGSGYIRFDRFGCFGDEANLFECYQLSEFYGDCEHKYDAGVICGKLNNKIM